MATGTFTALVPTPGLGLGLATAATADEVAPNTTALAAHFAPVDNSSLSRNAGLTTLLPVAPDPGGPDTSADPHLARLVNAANLADQLAKQHAKAAEQARIDGLIQAGGLNGWIAQALQVMDLPQSYAPGIKRIIMKESGGNPNAVNTWDSNAARGTPSRGLMQTIPSTYHHYVHPDLAGRPINDPVANITAGVRYMIDNYGVSTVAAGGRSNSYGGYVGY